MTGPSGDLASLLEAESRFAARLEAAKQEACAIVSAARLDADRMAGAAAEAAEAGRARVRERVRAETAARLEELRNAHANEIRRYSAIDASRRESLSRFVIQRLIDDVEAGGDG